MTIDYPKWVHEMDEYYASGIPFLAVISFDRNAGEVHKVVDCERNNILFHINGCSNYANDDDVLFNSQIEFEYPLFDRYKEQFEHVQKEIHIGNTYLLNLCTATKVIGKLDLLSLFKKSEANFRLYYKDQFIVFSPERFVTLEGNILKTFPMKGTIDAGINGAETKLTSDEKELAEHYTIVDLLRNDVGRVCDEIEVSRFGYVDEITTSKGPVLQMSSEITGHLSTEFKRAPGRLFYKMLPAGSISGAPKIKTLEIIDSVEDIDRGHYTGVMVHFDGHTIDSGVMIRFIERDADDNCWYKSGGGITHKSEVNYEYDEIIRKIYLPFL